MAVLGKTLVLVQQVALLHYPGGVYVRVYGVGIASDISCYCFFKLCLSLQKPGKPDENEGEGVYQIRAQGSTH